MALQLALPDATELPPDSPLASRRPHIAKPTPLPTYPALGQDDVFDPSRGKGGDATTGGGSGGALRAMGVISTGRGAAALIEAPGAAARLVRPGGSVGGWRLVSIGGDAVWVEKGAQRRRLVIGAAPEPAAPPPKPPAEPGDATE